MSQRTVLLPVLPLAVAVLIGALAGSASADAPDRVQLSYTLNLDGMPAVAMIEYTDFRIPEGSAGWFALGGASGSIVVAGHVRSDVNVYTFLGDLVGTVAYCDVVDHGTGQRFRIRLDFPSQGNRLYVDRVPMTVNPFEGLGQTVYLLTLAPSWDEQMGHPLPPEPDPSLPPGNTPIDLEVRKAKLKVNFKKASRDSFSLKLRAPGDDVVENARIVVDVGGVLQEFRLDSRGQGRNAFGTIKVKVKKGSVRIAIKQKHGNWIEPWRPLGLVDETRRGDRVSIPVRITIGLREYAVDLALSYDAKASRKGSAK